MAEENLSAESWSKYWTQASGEVGCLPGAPDALGNLLDGIWTTLAKELDPDAQVVDLACGNGVVGASMLSGNKELKITGVDYAEIDGGNSANFPIFGSTSITDMPFDDSSVDCAVSQFGIEYADIEATGTELVRVLKPAATIQFIVHCADSIIVQTNLKRHEILEHIYYSPLMRTNALNRQLQELQSDFNGLIAKYGEDSLVLEIASAIRSTLSDSLKDREKALLGLWEGMAQELNIINALQSAAVAKDDMGNWISKLGSDFAFKAPETISYDGNILCWSLRGTRSS